MTEWIFETANVSLISMVFNSNLTTYFPYINTFVTFDGHFPLGSPMPGKTMTELD